MIKHGVVHRGAVHRGAVRRGDVGNYCRQCGGSGIFNSRVCRLCKGDGKVRWTDCLRCDRKMVMTNIFDKVCTNCKCKKEDVSRRAEHEYRVIFG